MFAVVAFLVASFAIWGIGDIFRGFGLSTVAKIGGTEVTIDQFRQLYNDRLQQFSRQIGRPITPDQANALGLDRQIIGQYVSEIALDERARQLGLNVSDEEVANSIRSDQNFWGVNGQFDKNRFDMIIRQAGYTEPRFMAEQRRQMLRRQLATTVAGGVPVPKAGIEAFNRYQNEKRSIEYVQLTAADAGEIAAPTPEVLSTYFDERKSLFRAPEYRKLTIVSVIPGEQAQWMTISDDEAKQLYDQRRARYVTPERRHLQQIVFPTAEEAKAAEDKIKAGTSFADVAKERGLSASDIDLGTMAKAGIADRAVADAAFALKEGDVSDPIQGRFGNALVNVLKIEPEQVTSFEQASADIKREVATERAKAGVADTYNKLEDERASGATLAESAEKLKLNVRTIEAVDRSGRDPQGETISNIPDAQTLLASAFSTEPGVEVDPLQFDGGYIWFEVTDVTPSRERTLDEAKAQVEQRWRDDEVANRLKTLAADIVAKVQAGSSLAEAAGPERKIGTAADLTRTKPSATITPNVLEQVFRTPKGGAAATQGASPTEQIVFRVMDVVVPPFDAAAPDIKQTEQGLKTALSDGVIGEYVAKLQSEIGVTINQSALRQATGLSTDQGTAY